MEKQKNIPNLRFPEFYGDWERKKIKDLVEIRYGKDQKQVAIADGKYPIMGTGGEMGRTNVFLYDKPSVMIGRKGTIDKPRYMDTPFWTVDTLFYTEVFDNTNPKWLYYKFETINWYLYNEASGVPSLSSSTIYSIPIKTPTLPEQQKIASFFTAIDQKIFQLKRKKTLLEQYKKGVMQKIFSQKIRFKDDNGQEFPKWEKKWLGDMALSVSSGKSHERNSNGHYPLFGSTGVIGYADKYDYSGENILIARVGANAGSLYRVTGNYSVTDNTIILSLTEKFNSVFFFYSLISFNLNKLIFGSGQPLITGGQLKKIRLETPCFPEQTKIANFLSAIDNKISHTQKQIEKAEVWKKGLMQQMFV